jgi:inosine/xanthosine triphosphate pyrophosphatase family protein
MKLILASRNKKKIKEMEALLSQYIEGVRILSLDDEYRNEELCDVTVRVDGGVASVATQIASLCGLDA